ncbi:MAG: GNAT family N-acetyltransferase [Anaerolineaceae bacterium]|nr:GNAT family N-acetyltransferase [Anaerolineaceae bacterium]
MYSLRGATQQDEAAIKALIHQVGINPLGLDWSHFLLAVDENNRMIGCGQIKPHFDGTRELASIAVAPEQRGQGIARAIIERLQAENSPPLYLTCRSALEPMYEKFGFRALRQPGELSPYFKRLWRFAGLLHRLNAEIGPLSVMKWEGAVKGQTAAN